MKDEFTEYTTTGNWEEIEMTTEERLRGIHFVLLLILLMTVWSSMMLTSLVLISVL